MRCAQPLDVTYSPRLETVSPPNLYILQFICKRDGITDNQRYRRTDRWSEYWIFILSNRKNQPRSTIDLSSNKIKLTLIFDHVIERSKTKMAALLHGKDTTWMFGMVNWILQVHMYLLRWRKTNFFCIISILSRIFINMIYLYYIGCHSYTKIPLNYASYQMLATARLPLFQSLLHPLLPLSKSMLSNNVNLL